MAVSPLDGNIDNIKLTVTIEGAQLKDDYDIISVEIQRAVNKVSTAIISIALPFENKDNQSFEITESNKMAPGSKVEISAGYGNDEKSVFKGLLTNLGVKVRPGQVNLMVLTCSEDAVKMTLGRSSSYYKDLTDSAVISKVIGDHGLKKKVDTTSYKHKQLIKYCAVDWDFIVSRAEANGLLVYSEDDNVIVKSPVSSGSAALTLSYGRDVISFEAGIESRTQMPSVDATSWDMSKQDLAEGKSVEPSTNKHGNLEGKDLADVLGLKEFSTPTTTPLDKTDLKDWAKANLLKTRFSRISGTVVFFGNALPKINTLITLTGFGKRFNGDALITRISQKIKDGKWQTTVGFGLSHEWYYEKREINAPPASGLLPAIHGLQNGVVKKIDQDPDGEYRVQVDVPVIQKTGDGIWSRLAKFYATSGKGSFFMPEVGDEVILGFLNDDPRYPIILGSLYSSKIKAPYTPDKDNSIKAIVTKADLKLEFNDKDKVLTVETPAGNKMILSDKNKNITVQDQNGNKIVMSSSGIEIKSAKDITIQATGKIDLKANGAISAKSTGGDVSLNGLNVNAKANISFSAQGSASAELKAAGTTTIKGAMVMIN